MDTLAQALADHERERTQFISLKVPNFEVKSTCYLNSAASMGIPASQMISSQSLDEEEFPAGDLERAKREDSLWVWEEMLGGGKSNNLRAASSLHALLGHLGDPQDQRVALSVFEQFFGMNSLCFNDFREAGWDSVQSFLQDHPASDPFAQDITDRQCAIDDNQMWTLVDVDRGETVWASRTLPDLLARAWDHHPEIIRRRQLLSVASAAQDKATTTRGSTRKF